MLRYVGWVLRSLRKDLRLGNYLGIWQKVLGQLGIVGRLMARAARISARELVSVQLGVTLAAPITENLAAACRRRRVEFTAQSPELAPVEVLRYRQRALVLWLLPVTREVTVAVAGGRIEYRTTDSTGRIRWNRQLATSEFRNPVAAEPIVLRELARLELVDFDLFLQRWVETLPTKTLTSDRPIVLYLPEVGMRNQQLVAEDVVGFAGLTAPAGWLGCARSYRELAKLALEQNLLCLTVIEDDAVLTEGWLERAAEARSEIELGRLSVASGLASDLETLPAGWEARETTLGRYFVSSAFSSTVFTIFGRPALQWLAKFPSQSTDPNTGAIDRYLAELPGLQAAVFVPPLVTHMLETSSTLWRFGNRTYQAQIDASRKLIAAAVESRLGGNR